jgi:hypothetical protein
MIGRSLGVREDPRSARATTPAPCPEADENVATDGRFDAGGRLAGAPFLKPPASSSAFPLFAAFPHSHRAAISRMLTPTMRTRCVTGE